MATSEPIARAVQPPPPIQSVSPLLTKKQAAELLATSTRTIDRWLLDGVLPAESKVVIGRSTRFRSAVLLDHIDRLAEEATR